MRSPFIKIKNSSFSSIAAKLNRRLTRIFGWKNAEA
jgi:hypothetical protein